jgi:pyrroline-5-carboxylate reductase
MAPEGSLMIVGGGKMGEALITGLLRAGWTTDRSLVVVEQERGRKEDLEGRFSDLPIAGSVKEVVGMVPGGLESAGALVAVKPVDVEGVCRELGRLGVPRVLSIAAGVTTADIEGWLAEGLEPRAGVTGGEAEGAPSGPAVIRAMPNTPALVGAGVSAIAPGSAAGPDDVAWAKEILEAVGTVVQLPEQALDAVTGLSGSGPAYVFLIAEALIDAGVLVGLARPVAKQLAVQTLLGAARLLSETGDELSTLRAAVTSPGGTTAAGVRALEAGGVRSALMDAVDAATARSRELSRRTL